MRLNMWSQKKGGAPTRTVPNWPAVISRETSSARAMASRMVRPKAASSTPVSVGVSGRRLRSNSGAPTRSSISAMVRLSAGWVVPSRSAELREMARIEFHINLVCYPAKLSFLIKLFPSMIL
ncbi:MAG: hypothetical protein P8Y53_03300 [Pseudolabrys sp.]